MTCPAYAKVNLSLEVVGRRPDGFHEIVSLFQTVDLHDVVRVTLADESSLDCDDPSLRSEENLAWQALTLLRQRTGACPCAHVQLFKAIPTSAGLGGGSADAAATLLALDRLWQLGLSPEDLASLAAELGSDVPFFLFGGTALVRGRGETVEPLPDLPSRWLVLVSPDRPLLRKTAELYRRLRPDQWDDGKATLAAAREVEEQRFPTEALLRNTFEKVAEDVFPGLNKSRTRLAAAAQRPVHLSGSGPTLFATFLDRREAEWARDRLWREGERAFLVRAGPWHCSPRLGEDIIRLKE